MQTTLIPSRRPRGIALITALLVMALCAIAAAAVAVSAQTALRRSATLIDGEKAWWYATGLESWVRAVLDRDTKQSNSYDGLDEKWALEVDYLPVEQGALRGRLTDLQGRFNLNNFDTLAPTAGPNPRALAQFEQLFANIKGLNASQAKPIAEAIKDWIDADQTPTGSGGAEDSDYTSLTPPYLAANRQMQSPTELLALKGMTREIYQLLIPFVTALPLDAGTKTPTKINVNTAPYEVLMSLSPNMDKSKVLTWIDDRKTKPADAAGLLLLQGPSNGTLAPDVPKDAVDIRTSFFQMFGEASIGTGRVALYSVLMRPGSGSPVVIFRSLDTE